MTKLLWFDLNSSYSHTSLALPALHAQMLRTPLEVEVEWSVYSSTINNQVGDMVEGIYHAQPHIIAATCWLFNHEVLLQVLTRVKALLPHTTIVLGGPEFLGDNETFLRHHPCISAVFRGEGEEVFAQWLNLSASPQLWHTVQGLCQLTPEGEYHDGGMARVMQFDQLSPPEDSPFFSWDRPFLQLESTRGCFNSCAFCVSGNDRPVRTLSLEAIEQRLERIASHGARQIRMLDRTFNYQPQRAIALLKLFQRFAPTLSFHLEVHPALLGKELKELLPTLPPHLLHLEAGIQSLQPEVLTLSGRTGGVEAALEGLQYLSALPNMETHADLIAGLPHYTYPQLEEDVHTLASLHAGEIQLESLKLLPSTRMRREAAQLGITYSPLPPYEVLQTTAMGVDELRKSHLLSRLLDGYYNTPSWQEVTRSLMLHARNFIPQFMTYLAQHGAADRGISLERRGVLLYDFTAQHYPQEVWRVEMAWVEAGLSTRKTPAHRLQFRLTPPVDRWQVIEGEYTPKLLICYLPTVGGEGYWYGFDPSKQQPTPLFKAFDTNY